MLRESRVANVEAHSGLFGRNDLDELVQGLILSRQADVNEVLLLLETVDDHVDCGCVQGEIVLGQVDPHHMLALVLQFFADLHSKLLHEVLAEVYMRDGFVVKDGQDLSGVVVSDVVVREVDCLDAGKQSHGLHQFLDAGAAHLLEARQVNALDHVVGLQGNQLLFVLGFAFLRLLRLGQSQILHGLIKSGRSIFGRNI